jgi:diadenosine tetraphosphate (Ap4A) HIT family hydrolase
MTELDHRFDPACSTCQNLLGRISLNNTPRILETPYWIVEHIHPTSVRGWLVIVLRRHVNAVHQLTPAEIAEFGWLMPAACRALHELLGAEKEYVMQFAEGEGFRHVHFHVVARLPAWPDSLKGPAVFSALREPEAALPIEVTTRLSLAVREYLLREQSRLGASQPSAGTPTGPERK